MPTDVTSETFSGLHQRSNAKQRLSRLPFDLLILGAVPIFLRFRLLRLLGRLLFLAFVLVLLATFVAH
jgi:hypothetical protein